MKATITSTDRIVEIPAIGHPGNKTDARVWEGVTTSGIKFTAYIPLLMVASTDDNREFQFELMEHKPPEDWTRRAIDARMVL